MDATDNAETLAHTTRWLADSANRKWMYDIPKKELASIVSKAIHDKIQLGTGPYLNMQCLSGWYGMLAVNRLLKGDTNGWGDLQLSFLYRAWPTRFVLARQTAGLSKAKLQVHEHLLGFAHALAIRDDSFADIQGPTLLESLRGGNERYQGWKNRAFEIFIVKLYAILRKLPFEVNESFDCHLGVYQQVFDKWHSPTSLANVLYDACEHHWQETNDADLLGHIGAFSWSPYGSFPVDLLAIRRVREDLGLETPEIDHPLTNTLIAHLPQIMPNIHDDILSQIVDKARAEGIAGDPW